MKRIREHEYREDGLHLRCPKCYELKNETEFSKDKGSSTVKRSFNRASLCNVCRNKANKLRKCYIDKRVKK